VGTPIKSVIVTLGFWPSIMATPGGIEPWAYFTQTISGILSPFKSPIAMPIGRWVPQCAISGNLPADNEGVPTVESISGYSN
jgi:hypothetical protein